MNSLLIIHFSDMHIKSREDEISFVIMVRKLEDPLEGMNVHGEKVHSS